jgi:hypothetical protein
MRGRKRDKVRTVKRYALNAAIIAGGTVTAVLAAAGLDTIGETAGKIAAALMALGFMALVAKMPNPASGKHRKLNPVTLDRVRRN